MKSFIASAIALFYFSFSKSLFFLIILHFLLANDGDAQIVLRDLVELAVKVEDKSIEMGVLIPPFDEGVLVLVLDATVTRVLTSSSDATIVRSILLPLLCL